MRNTAEKLIHGFKEIEKYGQIIRQLSTMEPRRNYDYSDYYSLDESFEYNDDSYLEIRPIEFFTTPYYESIRTDWDDDFENDNKVKHEIYTRLKEIYVLILQWLYYYDNANIVGMQKALKSIEEILENEIIYFQFFDYGYDPEYILSNLYLIIDKTDFNTRYNNAFVTDAGVITDLNDEIIFQIKNNDELLFNINPRLFEELIFKILHKMKMNPILTKQTSDGGVDIIAYEDNVFTKNMYLIECKRYNRNKKVSIETVRQLYGVLNDSEATKAILVTTSTFTKPAILFAARHTWQLELKDYFDIKKWLDKYWHK